MDAVGSEQRLGVVDAAVHPQPPAPDVLREYIPEPLKRLGTIPPPYRALYSAPTGEPPYGEWLESERNEKGLPGSDPARAQAYLSACGVAHAILLPQTRGLIPNIDLGNAVCVATNEWLAEQWLEAAGDVVFAGSIRVNPEDPPSAVREIERWAADTRFVQIAVPMEAHDQYGHRRYAPIWEAAADCGLPVAIKVDGGLGADFFPTGSGYPRHHIEYASMVGLNFFYHLTSFIAEGVFERVPRLRLVFADGGLDLLPPLTWRLDNEWPASRNETPWIARLPSGYYAEHIRFCSSALEGTTDPAIGPAWAEIADAADLLLYGSHYPHWSTAAPDEISGPFGEETRARVLRANALGWYPRLSG